MYLFLASVTLRTEPPGATAFNESTYIDLVCDPGIDSSNGGVFSFSWTGPNGIVSDGSDYAITNQADNSTLRIQRLSVSRDNNAEYTCLVTVVLGNGTVQGNNSLTLSVQGALNNFDVFAKI